MNIFVDEECYELWGIFFFHTIPVREDMHRNTYVGFLWIFIKIDIQCML